MKIPDTQRGSVILYAMLTMASMLAIGLTINALFLGKFKSAAAARNSTMAMYIADSAVEMCLYEARSEGAQPPLVFQDPAATYSITNDRDGGSDVTADCSVLGSMSFGFHATGTDRGVSRTLEINQ